jgi:tRNA (guanine-N7-)-methyltransferase
LSSPADIIFSLPSIVEPLDLARLFAAAQPLEVELGSGDGSFLVQYAALHPKRNFIGVERLLGRLRKLERKCQRAGIAHVRGIRIEAAYFLEWLLPRNSAAALHIYFPDPWPKRKHHKNRLINDRFPILAHNGLVAGGVVYLRTDDADYFAQMQAVFAASPLFRPVETPEDLAGLPTDFERGFNSKGIPTLRAAYARSV